MKFVTEYELRKLYKDKPFTEYYKEPSVRLTPEAKQFLMDRKIEIKEEIPFRMFEHQESLECHKSEDSITIAIEEVENEVFRLYHECGECQFDVRIGLESLAENLFYIRGCIEDDCPLQKEGLILTEIQYKVVKFSLIKIKVKADRVQYVYSLNKVRLALKKILFAMKSVNTKDKMLLEAMQNQIFMIEAIILKLEKCDGL